MKKNSPGILFILGALLMLCVAAATTYKNLIVQEDLAVRRFMYGNDADLTNGSGQTIAQAITASTNPAAQLVRSNALGSSAYKSVASFQFGSQNLSNLASQLPLTNGGTSAVTYSNDIAVSFGKKFIGLDTGLTNSSGQTIAQEIAANGGGGSATNAIGNINGNGTNTTLVGTTGIGTNAAAGKFTFYGDGTFTFTNSTTGSYLSFTNGILSVSNVDCGTFTVTNLVLPFASGLVMSDANSNAVTSTSAIVRAALGLTGVATGTNALHGDYSWGPISTNGIDLTFYAWVRSMASSGTGSSNITDNGYVATIRNATISTNLLGMGSNYMNGLTIGPATTPGYLALGDGLGGWPITLNGTNGAISMTATNRTFGHDSTRTWVTNTAKLTSTEFTDGFEYQWYNGNKTVTLDKTNGNVTMTGNATGAVVTATSGFYGPGGGITGVALGSGSSQLVDTMAANYIISQVLLTMTNGFTDYTDIYHTNVLRQIGPWLIFTNQAGSIVENSVNGATTNSGPIQAANLVALNAVKAQGYFTFTNTFTPALQCNFILGTNTTAVAGAQSIGFTNVLNDDTSAYSYGELTLVATGTLTITNPPSWVTSDFVTSRTGTNGNTIEIAVKVQYGVRTNMIIVQSK